MAFSTSIFFTFLLFDWVASTAEARSARGAFEISFPETDFASWRLSPIEG